MSEVHEAPEDYSLVSAVVSGDDESFTELVRRYKRRVFLTVARYARSEDELDDICQEIFIKAYHGIGSFRGDAPFEHWLSRIAVNTCYDLLRRRQRAAEEVPLETVEHSLRAADSADISGDRAWESLRHAIGRLRPEDGLVITLVNIEERSVREVAGLTGWSEAKVKVRAFRARKELKKILEENNEGRSGR